MIGVNSPLGFIRCRITANATAEMMNKTEVVAVAPFASLKLPSALKPLNVAATISEKAAMTRMQNSQQNSRNNTLPIPPTYSSIIRPKPLPLLRTEANRAEKSCTAPKKMLPMMIHSSTGPQPNMAAMIGPLIGPAPAMEANWCPKRTERGAGT